MVVSNGDDQTEGKIKRSARVRAQVSVCTSFIAARAASSRHSRWVQIEYRRDFRACCLRL